MVVSYGLFRGRRYVQLIPFLLSRQPHHTDRFFYMSSVYSPEACRYHNPYLSNQQSQARSTHRIPLETRLKSALRLNRGSAKLLLDILFDLRTTGRSCRFSRRVPKFHKRGNSVTVRPNRTVVVAGSTKSNEACPQLAKE